MSSAGAWEVFAAKLGTMRVPERAVRTPGGEELVDVPLVMWILVSSEQVIVVDCGSHAAGSQRAKAHGYVLTRPAAEGPVESLASIGVTPAHVSHVVLTHLHWDHCANVELFVHAAVHTHASEIIASFEPPAGQAMAYESPASGYSPPWIGAAARIHLVDDDFTLVEGVRLLHTPGHTPGSLSVAVSTESGLLVIAGDLVAVESDLSGSVLPGLISDSLQARESLLRLSAMDARVLPSHDPRLFEGVVGNIVKVSGERAHGYSPGSKEVMR